MHLQQRINAFVQLGKLLAQFSSQKPIQSSETQEIDFVKALQQQMLLAKHHNGWFTQQNIKIAVASWSKALTEKNLNLWLSKYNITEVKSKKVAVVMAGNIPIVGFHDFLCILITGNKVLAKLSTNDNQLLPIISEYLITIEPSFKDKIEFTTGKLENFDSVIATGSNNTARYFDYYFGKYPNIIRKNRNAVAVLSGNEPEEQLKKLADDIFLYFGLGCRNVSKIYIPEKYDFEPFFNAMYSWKEVINNNKYMNNYDYNKAVYLMSNISLLDNEFMLLKEDTGFSSPISVLFYEYYKDVADISKLVEQNNEAIQCTVSTIGLNNEIPFGKAQNPDLWDYADGVDTIAFLLKGT